ncbi:MAG TPA: DUF5312 family protein [Spirochaetia bacterium]|nr:DUF5312 family protein [Spirochaetia bacterium]
MSRLEELSKELPEKERKALLERIGRRLEREEGEEAVAVELEDDERQKIISFEMKKASSWDRFLIWLRTFFSGRAREQVFLDIRLRHMKAHMRTAYPGITGFDTRDLSVKFARKLYDVYVAAQPVLGPYHALSSDKGVRGGAYSWLVEQKLPHKKSTLDDFVPVSEMEEIYSETGQTEEIRKKLSLRLNDYVRSIPESLLLELEEQVKLHLCLTRLAGFPFASLFRYFNWVLGDTLYPKYPPFEAAPVMLTLDLLERLLVTLALVSRSAPEYLYAEEPLAYYFLLRAGQKPSATATAENERVASELAQHRADVMELARQVAGFETAVPLLDLLRYFRRDPWFQLVPNPPRLYLRSLYFNTLKQRVSDELTERLVSVKERVIDRKIAELLKGQRTELEHFREDPQFDFRKLGLPYFTCTRSLFLVLNYLRQEFKGATQEAAQIVATVALANNRIIQSRLSQHVAGLEDLEARIAAFDHSLSPDEEDGKQMGRYRVGVATDLTLQKGYRSLVGAKDREARELVEKGREYLGGVRQIFDDIRLSTLENTRSLMKTLHPHRGRQQTLGQILNARTESIIAFLKLLDQLLEIEKGS